MIREVTMYQVVCDRCGKCAQEESEHWAWADPDQAEDDAEYGDWLILETEVGGEAHYCEGCTMWNDDEDERVPKRLDRCSACGDVIQPTDTRYVFGPDEQICLKHGHTPDGGGE